MLIRTIGRTLRISIDDRAGMISAPPDGPVIWMFWHSRIFAMPYIYERNLAHRHGAVLTSASGDGEIIARVIKKFGVDAVRGSSSRRRVGAMVGMVDWVKRGRDVVVTPDGPRGPRYVLQPGLVRLAQLTSAPVFPIHVRYASAWRLRTWDRFAVPKPFSRVDVVLDALRDVKPTESEDAFERERAALEQVMLGPDSGIDASDLANRRRKDEPEA